MKRILLFLALLPALLFLHVASSSAVETTLYVRSVVGCQNWECNPVYEDAVVKRNEYLLLYVVGYQPGYYSGLKVRFSGVTPDRSPVKTPVVTNDPPYQGQGLYEVQVQVPDDITLDAHTVQLVYKDQVTSPVEFSVIPNEAPTPTPNPSASPGGSGNPPPSPFVSPTPIIGASPGEVSSDLECESQGLVRDKATGLCFPKGNVTSQPGSFASTTSIGDLIKKILNVLLLMCGAVAVLMIVIGGYQFITSRGSEDQAKTGRKTITYAVMGIAAALLAYMIVTVVINFVTKGSPF